jgi:hypothetical protein
MLVWPSSQWIRYRGDGSPRPLPQRHRSGVGGSVDSDSATTRSPTSEAMALPSVFVLAEHGRREASVTTPSGRSHHPSVARPRAFSRCRPDCPPPQTHPVRTVKLKDITPKDRAKQESHVALNSLAAARTRRPVRTATAARAKRRPRASSHAPEARVGSLPAAWRPQERDVNVCARWPPPHQPSPDTTHPVICPSACRRVGPSAPPDDSVEHRARRR